MSIPSTFSAIKKLRYLLTKEDKFKWLCIACFAFFTSILEVVTAFVIIIFVQVLNQPTIGKKYLNMLGFSGDLPLGRIVFDIAIIVGIVYLVKSIFAAGEIFFQNLSIQKMNYKFKTKLLYRYAEADYGFYLTRNSALGMQVVGADAEHMFSSGMITLANVLSESIVFLCIVSMLVYMNPSLALAIFGICAVISIIVIKCMLPMFYTFGQKLQKSSLYGNQNLMQFFHAFKEIVLLGKRKTFIDAYQSHSRQVSKILALQVAVNAVPRIVIEVLFVGLFVITIAVLCLEHESPVQILGILGGYLYAGFRLMPGLNRIINQLNLFKSTIPSIERVYAEYISELSVDNFLEVPDFQFKHQISLNSVNFRYLNTKRDVLTDVTLCIKKGECIGIVGETGSGKSTIVDLILGLLKPTGGAVLIDDNYPVNSNQWHQKIGYVPQSIYLTDDSIEANIAFGEKDIDEDRLNEVIEAAQLRKFIDLLPQGSKTIVGERGVRLSGGERQRISIARALYHNPEVLIFDEATSALDNKTEEQIMKTIHEVRQNRTVIMVAHRLTTLKECNRIVVMKSGQIKDIITYDSLTLAQQSQQVSHG